MIYLNTIKASLTEHFNLFKTLTNQQKIVYAVACTVFTAICAYSIYRLYRACCLKKEQLLPADQKAKKVVDQVINQKDQVLAKDAKTVDQNQKVEDKKEEPAVERPARKALDINAPLGTDWTKEEIKSASQSIPQWLKEHFSVPHFTLIENNFILKCSCIEDADTLEESQKKFNAQLDVCIKMLSAHSNMEPRYNAKVPNMLRALHIPQDCSETERMAYTYIMTKAWTTIVQEGQDNACYPYVVRDGGLISEDSFKILQETVENNKTNPKTAVILTSFAPARWQQWPTPKLNYYTSVLDVLISDITEN